MDYLFYVYFAFVFALTVSPSVITFSCVFVLGLVAMLLGSRELKKHSRVLELKTVSSDVICHLFLDSSDGIDNILAGFLSGRV